MEKLLEEETKVSVSSSFMTCSSPLKNIPLSAEEVLVRILDAVFFFLTRRFFLSILAGGRKPSGFLESSEAEEL